MHAFPLQMVKRQVQTTQCQVSFKRMWPSNFFLKKKTVLKACLNIAIFLSNSVQENPSSALSCDPPSNGECWQEHFCTYSTSVTTQVQKVSKESFGTFY
jgi:hypothetical protein